MDEQPNELDRAKAANRRARGRHAAALAHKKLDPNNPAKIEALADAVGAAREAHGDYVAAANAALEPIKAEIDTLDAAPPENAAEPERAPTKYDALRRAFDAAVELLRHKAEPQYDSYQWTTPAEAKHDSAQAEYHEALKALAEIEAQADEPVKIVILVEGGLITWARASDTEADITVIYHDTELTGEPPISVSKEVPAPLESMEEMYSNVVRALDDPAAKIDSSTCLGCGDPLEAPNFGYCEDCAAMTDEGDI